MDNLLRCKYVTIRITKKLTSNSNRLLNYNTYDLSIRYEKFYQIISIANTEPSVRKPDSDLTSFSLDR